MTAAERWTSYFYPETYAPRTGQGVLKNLFGLRNPDKLRKREYTATTKRAGEIADGLVDIPPDVRR